jgi:hypothetical protein
MLIDQPPPQLVCDGLWRSLTSVGLERFELQRGGDDWVLRGSILLEPEGGAAEAKYEIVCDSSWRTTRAEIAARQRGVDRQLSLTVEGERWLVDGKEIEAVRGCIDIDLGWSPSTNTLPIRRLKLVPGAESGPLTAAWVRFPQLTVEPLPQDYERLAERRYRYRSRAGAFQAELVVDDHGLVLDYQGFWRRAGWSP